MALLVCFVEDQVEAVSCDDEILIVEDSRTEDRKVRWTVGVDARHPSQYMLILVSHKQAHVFVEECQCVVFGGILEQIKRQHVNDKRR